MTIKAVLLDIDGTLMLKGKAIAGAQRALRNLRDAGFLVRLLTNISARAPSDIAADLRASGFEVDDGEVQSAATACVRYVRGCAGLTSHLLVPDAMRPLFEGVDTNDEEADLVVIGDIGEQFNYTRLNNAFRMLRDGARLVVPHKNLFWYDDDGPRLDAGAFVIGLEAASGQPALVTGKPSPVFFNTAMDELGVAADETVVVGDDIQTDIAGARHLGLHSILVRTGKGSLQRPADYPRPEHEIDSIGDLIDLLDRIGAINDLSKWRLRRAISLGGSTQYSSAGRAAPWPPEKDGAA
jgi:HAD superfamily hydrolase (TIGR01458 family)